MSEALPNGLSQNGAALRPAASIDSRRGTLYASERAPLTIRQVFHLLRKTWPFIRVQRRLIVAKSSLALLSLSLFLLTPWPMKLIIDNVIDGRPLSGVPALILRPLAGDDRALLLDVICIMLFVAMLLTGSYGVDPHELNANVDSGGLDQSSQTANKANEGWSLWNGLLGLTEVWITIQLTQRMNQSLRTAIYEKFLRSPVRLYADQKIGDAVFRVMLDSASVGSVLYDGVLTPAMAILAFVMGITVLGFQFPQEPEIPILAAIVLPITILGSALFGGRLRGQGQRMRERGSDVMAAFEERLSNVQTIKAFGREQHERNQIDAASWRSYQSTLRMLAVVVAAVLLCGVGVVLVVGYGFYHLMLEVIRKQITLGDIVLLGGYAYMLGRPAIELGATWAKLQEPIAGLRRVHSVLDGLGSDYAGGVSDIDGPITEIELRDLSVGYAAGAPVLERVNLVLRRGELVGLAGPSGAGKSTLISVLPRLLEALDGQVLINGADWESISTNSLRRKIAFVFQQEALFSSTLEDNIRYGKLDASADEIARAAKAAGAADFIEILPDGYKTMLGRRGARLSVGQKQRIAIARALLRNPDVLVLDEPMAPLDPGSEQALLETLRAMATERIVVVVAHRPDTLEACDRVYFVYDRTIPACGRHTDLIRTFPAYRLYLAEADTA